MICLEEVKGASQSYPDLPLLLKFPSTTKLFPCTRLRWPRKLLAVARICFGLTPLEQTSTPVSATGALLRIWVQTIPPLKLSLPMKGLVWSRSCFPYILTAVTRALGLFSSVWQELHCHSVWCHRQNPSRYAMLVGFSIGWAALAVWIAKVLCLSFPFLVEPGLPLQLSLLHQDCRAVASEGTIGVAAFIIQISVLATL